MRTLSLLAALFSFALTACGNADPQIYRTAIAHAPFAAVPASCYTGGIAPTTTDQTTNEDEKADWTLWSGSNLQYLDLGASAIRQLGSLPQIDFSGTAIEGGPTAFTATDVANNSTTGTTTTISITVTFGATPGDTSAGTIEYKSAVSGGAAPLTCDVSSSFVGRKVDTQSISNYGFNGFPLL